MYLQKTFTFLLTFFVKPFNLVNGLGDIYHESRRGGEWLLTRQSLLERLCDLRDDDSWREFYRTYWKLIYRAATSAGLSSEEAEDVVQETMISVARRMETFRYEPATLGS